ncbi:Pycsar system effector family protein [Tistlia consotensis]|nr:Pycsar system effector family protein [Tistlia consotensis]
MDLLERGRFADFLHQSLNHNIALADRKASIVFTLATAVIVFVLQRDPALLRGAAGIAVQASWICVLLVLLASAATAFGVVFPRIHRRRNGLLFWSNVAGCESAAAYAAGVTGHSNDALLAAKFEHCHALARICRAKYRLLRISMTIAALGLAGFVTVSTVSALS